ncbi:MAG: hypothetical protein R3200_07925 [Xanthomonadales bacterium]|nr:hypothetical protein [Xanthomonadales bacterium]
MRTTNLIAALFVGLWLLPAAAEEPWLEFYWYSEKIVNRDPTPRLRIYADGEAWIYRPAYFRDPGLFAIRLAAEDINALLDALTDPALLDADLDALAERMAATKAKDDRYFYTSDATITRIVFRPAHAPGAISKSVAVREWRWKNLVTDAERHPGIDVLERLVDVQSELQALARRPGERLGPARPVEALQ